MSTHVPLAGSRRVKPEGAKRVRDVDPEHVLRLTVALADRNPETAERVTAVLTDHGLKLVGPAGDGRSLRLSGTAAQIETVFRPGAGVYTGPDQQEFVAREGELSIPSELHGLVSGVFGLDKRRMAYRRGGTGPAAGSSGSGADGERDEGASRVGGGIVIGAAAASAATPYSPADVSGHYNFPAGNGAGQTVAIAEFGGGYFANDLQAFCQKQGTAVPTVTTIGVNGAKPLTLQEIQQLPSTQQQQQLDDSVEVNMDVQIVAGLAPAAEITVYFSNFDEQGWVDLLDDVISAPPVVALSVSWGLAEDDPSWSSAAVQAIDQRLAALAAAAITACVAAGDDGSADQETDGKAHVDFPASSPHALAVGGTMLTGSTDVVWWQSPGERTSSGGGATGGGVSTVFPKPAWQDGVNVASINAGAIAGRIVPDIAALAGPPYYDLIFMGQDSPNGGTSAATPTWASLLALMAAAAGTPWKPAFLAPLLYASAPAGSGGTVGSAGCTDVTSGNNISSTLGSGYSAGPGFDAVSGWGVPDGVQLLAALTGS